MQSGHSRLIIGVMESYRKPSKQQRFTTVIKKSRFITTVTPVVNKTNAAARLADIRQEFPDANHHCWAVVAGAPDDVYQQDQSDDGEPKGTAGKPMLNVLNHSQLGNCLVVVTRYFGGVKLGAGGLVRAYTQATSEALKSLITEEFIDKAVVTITLSYENLRVFEYWLTSLPIDTLDKSFDMEVTLKLACPKSELQALIEKTQQVGGRYQGTNSPL